MTTKDYLFFKFQSSTVCSTHTSVYNAKKKFRSVLNILMKNRKNRIFGDTEFRKVLISTQKNHLNASATWFLNSTLNFGPEKLFVIYLTQQPLCTRPFECRKLLRLLRRELRIYGIFHFGSRVGGSTGVMSRNFSKIGDMTPKNGTLQVNFVRFSQILTLKHLRNVFLT